MKILPKNTQKKKITERTDGQLVIFTEICYNDGMKITVLDFCTVTKDGDIDFAPLEALGEVRYADLVEPDEIARRYGDTEAFLINKANMTREVIAACPRLRYIGTFATGYNNVDTEACRERGVALCNVPDYSTHAVAQHAASLLLNCAGNTDRYCASVAAGDWVKSKSFSYFAYPMRELYAKTVGIVGYGHIGAAFARICEALGMRVLVHTRTPKPCPYPIVSLETLLRESDFVSLHCPLTAENAKMLNEETLALMKPTAFLINTARGGLVDESALAAALNEGRLAGAALDVVTSEPMLPDNPLQTAKNCRITPHVAWAPLETRRRLFQLVVENLQAFLEGASVNRIV